MLILSHKMKIVVAFMTHRMFSFLLAISLVKTAVSEECKRKYVYITGKTKCPFNIPENGTQLDHGVCIENSYESEVGPGVSGRIENTTKEEMKSRGASCLRGCHECCKLRYTPVFTTINYHMVREINDKQRTLTTDISLSMFWMDRRIETYRPPMLVDKEQAKKRVINLPLSRTANIWIPDLYVYNLSEYRSFKNSINVVSLQVLPTHYQDRGFCLTGPMVKYEIEAKITFFCELDYSHYPMDYSNCKLRFGSRRSDTTFVLHDNQSRWFNNEVYRVLDFDVKSNIIQEKQSDLFALGSIGLDIEINRVIQPHMLKYYIPSIIITIVSQCSFIIPISAIPGRISLIITSLLTLISIFLQQMVSTKDKK